MILKLVSDRAESWSQNLKLIFRGSWWLKIIVLSILYKLALVYFSFHSSYVVCFVMSLFKTTALPVCICKRRLARWRSLCTLILKLYGLACSRSSPPLPPFPLPSFPPNSLYLFWNVYLCMCFRLPVQHNCSHLLIFLRTCLQSSDNVLIANC